MSTTLDPLVVLGYFRTAPPADAERVLDLARTIMVGRVRRRPEVRKGPSAKRPGRHKRRGAQRRPDSIRAAPQVTLTTGGSWAKPRGNP